jgi:putative membrane protein
MLLHWLLSALSLLIVARLIPGIQVSGFLTALLAALVIGLVNSTLGLILKVLTLPLTILTLGLFWLVINALMLDFSCEDSWRPSSAPSC